MFYTERTASLVFTRDTLYEVGHHGAKVGSDVSEDLHVFVVLSLQKHSGQVHILQKESAKSQSVTFQCSISTEQKQENSKTGSGPNQKELHKETGKIGN